uniref:Uncharacterized protein n=1 Tax=Heterorhabditis bacteriophora TaxID=37862 RepID=A0A1I7X3I8_HETBA
MEEMQFLAKDGVLWGLKRLYYISETNRAYIETSTRKDSMAVVEPSSIQIHQALTNYGGHQQRRGGFEAAKDVGPLLIDRTFLITFMETTTLQYVHRVRAQDT